MATVLVFDDDPEMLRNLEKILSGLEHMPLTATSGAQAAHYLECIKIDVLILAQEMNNQRTGIDFLKAQKKHPLSKHGQGEYTPFLLMSKYKEPRGVNKSALRQAAFKEGGEFFWKYDPSLKNILPGLIESARILAHARRIKSNV